MWDSALSFKKQVLRAFGLESSENGMLFYFRYSNEDPIEEEVLEAGGEVKDEAC